MKKQFALVLIATLTSSSFSMNEKSTKFIQSYLLNYRDSQKRQSIASQLASKNNPSEFSTTDKLEILRFAKKDRYYELVNALDLKSLFLETQDHLAFLTNPKNFKLTYEIVHEKADTNQLLFDKYSEYLVVKNSEKFYNVYHLSGDWQNLQPIELKVNFSNDQKQENDRWIIAPKDEEYMLYEKESLKKIASFYYKENTYTSPLKTQAIFSPNGQYLAVIESSKKIVIYSAWARDVILKKLLEIKQDVQI